MQTSGVANVMLMSVSCAQARASVQMGIRRVQRHVAIAHQATELVLWLDDHLPVGTGVSEAALGMKDLGHTFAIANTICAAVLAPACTHKLLQIR